MPKNDVGGPKWLANKMKSKGLQKLRWFCQMCEKQCRDENGFKCHVRYEHCTAAAAAAVLGNSHFLWIMFLLLILLLIMFLFMLPMLLLINVTMLILFVLTVFPIFA